jgi:hypothetical protein
MQKELIQSLEKNTVTLPVKGREALIQVSEPLKERDIHALSSIDSIAQDYTIQEDMKGMAGTLDGLFGI